MTVVTAADDTAPLPSIDIATVIRLIETALPMLGAIKTGNAFIDVTIQVLAQALPVIIKEARDLYPIVKNIIAALKDGATVTQEQWDALDVLERQIDADFDAAAAAARAEDAR
jgi:hypothetical protein